jgi:hypothetical protein
MILENKFIYYNEKQKNTAVGTFPKFNRKIVERGNLNTPITWPFILLPWYRHVNEKWLS